jgi:hypothetical protein
MHDGSLFCKQIEHRTTVGLYAGSNRTGRGHQKNMVFNKVLLLLNKTGVLLGVLLSRKELNNKRNKKHE